MQQAKSLYSALSKSTNPMGILMQNPNLKSAYDQLSQMGGMNEQSFRQVAKSKGYSDQQIDEYIQNVRQFLS